MQSQTSRVVADESRNIDPDNDETLAKNWKN